MSSSIEFKKGDWNCFQCGTHNFANRTACFGCARVIQRRGGGSGNRGVIECYDCHQMVDDLRSHRGVCSSPNMKFVKPTEIQNAGVDYHIVIFGQINQGQLLQRVMDSLGDRDRLVVYSNKVKSLKNMIRSESRKNHLILITGETSSDCEIPQLSHTKVSIIQVTEGCERSDKLESLTQNNGSLLLTDSHHLGDTLYNEVIHLDD